MEQIKQLSYKLRLLGLHSSLERRHQEAISNDLDYADFLRLLLEDESLYRKGLVTKRLITRAKFRTAVDLENWDTSIERGIHKAKFKELSLGTFCYNRENLIILGKTGAGKTHLAIALGRRLCQLAIKVMFYSTNLFFEEVQSQKAAGRYLNFIRKLNKAEVLVFDDFGLRSYTHEEATILMDLLEERYGKSTLIITSQVDPKGWKKLFEDPVIAESIVDRMVHPSQKVELNNDTYRAMLATKKDSKTELRKEEKPLMRKTKD